MGYFMDISTRCTPDRPLSVTLPTIPEGIVSSIQEFLGMEDRDKLRQTCKNLRLKVDERIELQYSKLNQLFIGHFPTLLSDHPVRGLAENLQHIERILTAWTGTSAAELYKLTPAEIATIDEGNHEHATKKLFESMSDADKPITDNIVEIRRWFEENQNRASWTSTNFIVRIIAEDLRVVPRELRYLRGALCVILSENSITKLSSGCFKGMVNLRSLYIQKNPIATADPDIFDPTADIQICYLDINSNPTYRRTPRLQNELKAALREP